MKIIVWLLIAFWGVLANAEMVFRSALPDLNGDILEVNIGEPTDPVFYQVKIAKISVNGNQELGKLNAAPMLPLNPDDRYTDYQGESSSRFQLRVYNESTSPLKWSAVLRWTVLADGVPIVMKRTK